MRRALAAAASGMLLLAACAAPVPVPPPPIEPHRPHVHRPITPPSGAAAARLRDPAALTPKVDEIERMVRELRDRLKD